MNHENHESFSLPIIIGPEVKMSPDLLVNIMSAIIPAASRASGVALACEVREVGENMWQFRVFRKHPALAADVALQSP